MNPAFSVLFFTTASGAGYGLLAWLGLLGALEALPAERWLGFTGLGLALALVTVGLLSSTFHLGHPERAWRALSQWRSSWLSREGVMAVATYLPAGLFGIGWVFLEETGGLFAVFGLLAALGATLTVVCTAMIYASLKPIRQWRNLRVPPLYFGFAATTGALWCQALVWLFGLELAWLSALVVVTLLLTWALKLDYWRAIDRDNGGPSLESATGLGRLGAVRTFERPHTEENYLLKEMGYRIGRKHAKKLRQIAGLLFGALPLAATLLLFGFQGALGIAVALLAALAGTVGAFVERWLFFAEAKHSVRLYYRVDG